MHNLANKITDIKVLKIGKKNPFYQYIKNFVIDKNKWQLAESAIKKIDYLKNNTIAKVNGGGSLDENIYEIKVRIRHSGVLRIYYTISNNQIIILNAGGKKSTDVQTHDMQIACDYIHMADYSDEVEFLRWDDIKKGIEKDINKITHATSKEDKKHKFYIDEQKQNKLNEIVDIISKDELGDKLTDWLENKKIPFYIYDFNLNKATKFKFKSIQKGKRKSYLTTIAINNKFYTKQISKDMYQAAFFIRYLNELPFLTTTDLKDYIKQLEEIAFVKTQMFIHKNNMPDNLNNIEKDAQIVIKTLKMMKSPNEKIEVELFDHLYENNLEGMFFPTEKLVKNKNFIANYKNNMNLFKKDKLSEENINFISKHYLNLLIDTLINETVDNPEAKNRIYEQILKKETRSIMESKHNLTPDFASLLKYRKSSTSIKK
jgi:putative component of toxin-antitoxin plasmid stabilization module